jgi:AcrR family transcriptional regulator
LSKPGHTSPRRRAPADRRRAILDAARRLLNERDFHAIRMEDVALRADVAKGTLYLYFKTKEDLFGALMADLFRYAESEWEKIVAATRPGTDRIRALIASQLQFFEKNQQLFVQVIQRRIAVGGGSRIPGPPEFIRWNLKIMEESIRDALRQRVLRRVNPREAAVVLFGMLRGFAFARIFAGLSGNLPDRAGFVWDCFYRAFRP